MWWGGGAGGGGGAGAGAGAGNGAAGSALRLFSLWLFGSVCLSFPLMLGVCMVLIVSVADFVF